VLNTSTSNRDKIGPDNIKEIAGKKMEHAKMLVMLTERGKTIMGIPAAKIATEAMDVRNMALLMEKPKGVAMDAKAAMGMKTMMLPRLGLGVVSRVRGLTSTSSKASHLTIIVAHKASMDVGVPAILSVAKNRAMIDLGAALAAMGAVKITTPITGGMKDAPPGLIIKILVFVISKIIVVQIAMVRAEIERTVTNASLGAACPSLVVGRRDINGLTSD